MRSARYRSWLRLLFLASFACASCPPLLGASQKPNLAWQAQALEAAINDLIESHGDRYSQGTIYLHRLEGLKPGLQSGESKTVAALASLRREALLANPLLAGHDILAVKRQPRNHKPSEKDKQIGFSHNAGFDLGFPSNHECNSSLPRTGYDNEIVILSLDPKGNSAAPRTLYRPDHSGYVGEIDLHWAADRFLFTQSDAANWKVFELNIKSQALRPVTEMPEDVDAFDACYLPDGGIVFGSTASFQSVPCWHGQKRVSNLYRMQADGSGVRQLCFDQDHNFHPTVLPNGQLLYHRWDYTGINHIFLRQLMVMNPDGTGQRAVYGANSWFPNSLYFPQALPGESGRVLAILSGYHGVHKMGQLVVIDPQVGWGEGAGIEQRLSGRFQQVQPKIADVLVNGDWPKFLHPFPISDKYYLVSGWLAPKRPWGIYLVDTFDNLVLIHEEPGWALLEPVLIQRRPTPQAVPSRIDPSRDDGILYLHNIYAGPGLEGVPRDTVKALRVLAYDFGYVGLAGPDKVGLGGPWEVMQILGTTPVYPDGSAMFRVPANTPLAVQPLDAEGKAVQLMRSWLTVMPGETASCIGCHERPGEAAPTHPAIAATRPPNDITPWHGPERGFSFEREVQPVLDRHCVTCHHGQTPTPTVTEKALCAAPDLRPAHAVPGYVGRRISPMGINRLHPEIRANTDGILRFTPAYEALIPYIRRVGIEDDVSLLTPGEYHADTSPLIQLLRKGHQGVALTAEDWDRLVTWIDLNGPCHGSWQEVHPVPNQLDQRRAALRQLYGPQPKSGSPAKLAAIANTQTRPPIQAVALQPAVQARSQKPSLGNANWGFDHLTASQMQKATAAWERSFDLGEGLSLHMVRIPTGTFRMGDTEGEPDESPPVSTTIDQPFWMAVTEISNTQFRRFKPEHQSGYYTRRHARSDDRGLTLDAPNQPAVRVSWDDAMDFCQWLSERSGAQFNLPTEAQWEWACRAGSLSAWPAGNAEADFSPWANLADVSFSRGLMKNAKQITGGLEHLVLEGADLSDRQWNDGAVVTASIGSYQPNAWGLYDLHGNAAEWTLSGYQPYSDQESSPRQPSLPRGRKVVRGGSFFDPARRARSSYRLDYPHWQRVFNVGFRVVCETHPDLTAALAPSRSR